MDADYQTIELYEDPTFNWRRSYLTGLEQTMQDLRQERYAQVKRRIYIGQETYVVKDLTDAQLELVARRELERSTEAAIIRRERGELGVRP